MREIKFYQPTMSHKWLLHSFLLLTYVLCATWPTKLGRYRKQQTKGFTVRQFEAAVNEEVIACGISGTDHHSVFHDLLCIQRHPLTDSFLLVDKGKTHNNLVPKFLLAHFITTSIHQSTPTRWNWLSAHDEERIVFYHRSLRPTESSLDTGNKWTFGQSLAGLNYK